MNIKELLAAHKAKQAASASQTVIPTNEIFKQLAESPAPVSKPIAQAPSQNDKLKNILAALQSKRSGVSGRVISGTSSNGTTESIHESVSNSQPVLSETLETISAISEPKTITTTDKHGATITYNQKQQEFINLVLTGKSCILIGAAGTGKTTCMKGVVQSLIQAGMVPTMSGHNHKYLPQNVPGLTVSAYTRRATNNIRKNLSSDIQGNAITIHKLLEYQPEYVTTTNDETGKEKTSMSFQPNRHALNPLPSAIAVCFLEESSMISVELFEQINSAMAHGVQYIFLGDIQQLPPVFGSAILGYKMLELPVIELTEVYRQALESPIIRLAHHILSGQPIPASAYKSWAVPGQLTIHPWKKRIAADSAVITLSKFFLMALSQNTYNPETDAILIPFNKSCGTDELNKYIAGAVAKRDGKLVWEIAHGFKKSYYSVGDKCLYDREDAIITNIYKNPQYTGATVQSESKTLNYWGHKEKTPGDSSASDSETDTDIDFLLQQVAVSSGEDDTVRAASHVIELLLLDSERTIKINQAGELNNLILGYAITVHKSQGSEWDKVFVCFHHSHNTMLCRELLYTAVTRPKKELFVICEEDTFTKGILNQRIKGNTLAEKAIYFQGKLDRGELQS